MAYGTFTTLCNPHDHLVLAHFHHPKRGRPRTCGAGGRHSPPPPGTAHPLPVSNPPLRLSALPQPLGSKVRPGPVTATDTAGQARRASLGLTPGGFLRGVSAATSQRGKYHPPENAESEIKVIAILGE